MLEFKEWPKTPRLNRDMIVTEKIDGTNAAVIVLPVAPFSEGEAGTLVGGRLDEVGGPGILVDTELGQFVVAAQSRKRIVSPGKQTDNAGFARWVRDNAQELAEVLGEGYHYGEWWNAQNARKALQPGEQRLSLFNVSRYADADLSRVPGLTLVPVLHMGVFDQSVVNTIVDELRKGGSYAHPEVAPEGVIVFHVASGHVYKVLCENDEIPKGVQA